MTLPNAACIALFFPLLAACSTVASGTTQLMTFQSTPDEVTVTLTTLDTSDPTHIAKSDTRVLGTTPLSVEIDRGDDQTVTFSKAGYKPLQLELTTEANPWLVGNIIIGGGFGSTTDVMSGAAYEYVPDKYFVTLMPEQATSIDTPTHGSQREKIREFIVFRHDALLRDIHQRDGEDLSALIQLLHIPVHDEQDAQSALQTLATKHSDAGAFADQVVETFRKQMK